MIEIKLLPNILNHLNLAKEKLNDSLANKLSLSVINLNFKAASKYCDDQNMEFKVFTEKELGIY